MKIKIKLNENLKEENEHLQQTYSDQNGEYAVKDIVNYAYKKKLQNFSVDELAELAFQHSADEDFDEKPGSPEFVARAKKSDLKFPIVVIQYPDGKFIADGNHRLWKARSLGMKQIKGFLISPKELQSLPRIDNLDEMSGAGGGGFGAIEGGMGKPVFKDITKEMRNESMDREQFLEELKLRKHIKDAIRLYERRNNEVLTEERKLRSVIRQMIKESEEDRPHHSTGINVLSDLLKKVVPVLEIDYKKMTSSPTQRQSFRAHILKAAQNALTAEKTQDDAGTSESGGIQEDDDGSAAIDLDVGQPPDPEQEKFIDIERPSQKKAAAKNKPDPVDAFGIEGEDETGRNIAMSSFQKVEKAITESYSILSDAEDKRLFFDYLITNLKLYFDKFEDELKANVEEPNSNTYDQEKSQQQNMGSDMGDLGGEEPQI